RAPAGCPHDRGAAGPREPAVFALLHEPATPARAARASRRARAGGEPPGRGLGLGLALRQRRPLRRAGAALRRALRTRAGESYSVRRLRRAPAGGLSRRVPPHRHRGHLHTRHVGARQGCASSTLAATRPVAALAEPDPSLHRTRVPATPVAAGVRAPRALEQPSSPEARCRPAGGTVVIIPRRHRGTRGPAGTQHSLGTMSGVISRTPAAGREHLSGYQARDYDIVDYRMYELPGTRLWFRGPMPDLEAGRYFTCIGAAQTFGCFCSQPFPDLLAQKLGLPSLNLGYGGAGPEFFARQ